MRIRTKAGLISLGALAFTGTMVGPAHADTNVHVLAMGGSTSITDHETFGSNERCTRSLNGSDFAQLPFDNVANIVDTDNKCGGEVRVEFHVTGTLFSDGGWCASGVARLYEGTSTSTGDLDGTKGFGGCVGLGQTITISDTVFNTDEGGDKAGFTISLTAS
jgi:hypothetical protein